MPSPQPGKEPIALLFLCVENACRSQMAEAFARAHAGKRIMVFSAGSSPRGQVDGCTREVMKERGISLDGHRSKGMAQLPDLAWDVVVGMGCGDACPQLNAKLRLEWQIPAPGGTDLSAYRQVRDTIEQHVTALLNRLLG